MEAIITKKFPLQFDENGNALIAFDYKTLSQAYAQYNINRSTEIITVTESYIYVTYRASEKLEDSTLADDTVVYFP
jgi:hypothetical protein